MSRCALLTCRDLSEYVIDDRLMVEAFDKLCPDIETEWVNWDSGVDWNNFDWAILRTTWDYTERLEEFLSVIGRIENSSCRLFNPPATVRWNARKTYLKELQQNGVAVIPSLFSGEWPAIENWHHNQVVIKPVVGANSSRIQVVEIGRALGVCEKLSDPEDWFIQPFLPQIRNGEISYHYFNGRFSHAIRKVPKAGDYRVQEKHGAEILPHTPSCKELAMAEKALAAVDGTLLYARVDAVVDDQAWLLMELELIEPSLYFRMDEKSGESFVRAFRELASNN